MQNDNEKNVRKTLYLALAIFVAIMIWIYVDEFGGVNGGPRVQSEKYDDVPIEYINEESLLDRGLMLVDEGTDQTVDLELEGTRRLIADIDRNKILITADLSNVTEPGVQNLPQYRISYSGRRLNGQRITITQSMIKEVSPFSATVNVKELNSKPVEVRCELRGTVADGYTAGQLKMSHNSIEIWGQEQDIAPVSYAKVTLDIGSGAVDSVSESLPITFYDENNEPLDGTGIRSTADEIKVSMPVSVTKELRLAVKFKDAPGVRQRNVNVNIEPKSIMVSGDASQLNGVEAITLTEIDLLELKNQNGSGVYNYPITVPEGCTNLSGVTRATVTLSFKDMASAELTTNHFRYDHLPDADGKTVEILTEEMTVSIFGTSADVGAITPDQVTIVADLSDYTAAAGSYSVPAHVEVNGGGDVGVAGSYEVRVVIHEGTAPEEPENEQTGELE